MSIFALIDHFGLTLNAFQLVLETFLTKIWIKDYFSPMLIQCSSNARLMLIQCSSNAHPMFLKYFKDYFYLMLIRCSSDAHLDTNWGIIKTGEHWTQCSIKLFLKIYSKMIEKMRWVESKNWPRFVTVIFFLPADPTLETSRF